MNIALIVMPSRRKFAEAKILPYLPNDTIVIERPDLTLSDCHEITWDTVRGDEWGMVLHDDVILCNNFMESLESVMKDCGERRFISLYSPRKTARTAMESGAKWCRDAPSAFLGEEAVLMRTDLIDEYLVWLDEGGQLENRIWHDEQLRLFLMAKREPAWICVPNLVDHASDVLPSLVGHPAICFGKPRKSTTFKILEGI